MMGLRLDLGSGRTVCDTGFIGVDLLGRIKWSDAEPDDVCYADLREPWPWDDSSVEGVWCAHLIQYLTGPEWVHFVDELWRVLEPNSIARFVWPNLRTARAFQDPLAKSNIPLEWWSYASREWRVRHGPPNIDDYPHCDLVPIEYSWEGLHDDFIDRDPNARQFWASHAWDFAADSTISLKAVKP